jgi:hypothetical protein
MPTHHSPNDGLRHAEGAGAANALLAVREEGGRSCGGRKAEAAGRT